MRTSLTNSVLLFLLVLFGAANSVVAQGDPLGPELARMNALTKSGNEKLRNKDIDGALKDFNEAILTAEPFPNNVRSGTYLSRARALEAKGDLDGALRDLDKAISLFRDNFYAYQNRAHLHTVRKDPEKAIADYSKVIKMNSKFPFAYRGRGLLLLEIGKDAEAEADFAKFLQFNPNEKASLDKQIQEVKDKRQKKQ